jgi:hypothetical protein
MPTLDYVRTYDTIAAFTGATLDSDLKHVYIRGYSDPAGRGGGFLRKLVPTPVPPPTADGVVVFRNGPLGTGPFTYWMRDLEGGAVDAYMAGAIGGAVLNPNGTIDPNSPDDTAAIMKLLGSMFRYTYPRANSLTVPFQFGQ